MRFLFIYLNLCYLGLNWLVEALKNPPPKAVQSSKASTSTTTTSQPVDTAAQRMEQLLLDWIGRVDEPDDVFLTKLDDATLDSWDHYTHLRIAFLYLQKYERRQAMPLIFEKIKSFIERSPRTRRGDNSRGTTFHETMTYFWVHMV